MVFIAGDTLRHQPMGSWSHDCSSSAGLLDSYPALVLYLAGDALHQQPMGSRSHDCSSYVGCGGIPCSILVSPNASLHKWQQAVAPGWLPYMVPQNWIQARTHCPIFFSISCSFFLENVAKSYVGAPSYRESWVYVPVDI